MPLTPVTMGATTTATDLNQVVNLLNGTTTNTQLTVNGPISAQMTGTTAPMRYVGGVAPPLDLTLVNNQTYTTPGVSSYYAPIQVPLLYNSQVTASTFGTTSNGTYYGASDVTWAPGGPMAIGATAPTSQPNVVSPVLANVVIPGQTGPLTIGAGGYVCRAHQAGAVTVSPTAPARFGVDTVDFDPRGMYRPSQYGSGGAITLPFPGMWLVVAVIHATANTMTNQWFVGYYQGGTVTATGTSMPAPDSPSNSSATYTGTVLIATFLIGNDTYTGAGWAPGYPPQLCFFTENNVVTTYSLDVSGADRTYIACYLVG